MDTKNLEDVNTFISKNPTDFDMPDTWYQLVIVAREFDTLIGDVGFHFIDEYQCEIGWTLSIEIVYRYIQKQKIHHKTKTFKEEYLDLLKQHEIEFNDKYLFNWLE